jgi:hypothetical protein
VTRATRYRDFSDIQPGISGRPGLTKTDWGYFRPNDVIPTKRKDIVLACEYYYYTVGLIRNIIDLMADFASQGIRISHPNKRLNKFFNNWFTKVNGRERSERFISCLLRTGTCIVKVHKDKMTKSQRDEMYKSVAGFSLGKNEVPWKYTFLHPASVEVVGGALASFVGHPVYGINLDNNLRTLINSPRTPAEKATVAQLPEDIKAAAKSGEPIILPPENTLVYHYKKDDWQPWAYPMIYAIIDDINMLEQLRLADRAALDGAISNIRIFKLGDIENKIAPKAAAAAKLAEILESNVGGGTMDIVWGPDIDLIESNTSVHQFLGEDKYKPHLNSIYAGLGIPPTLTGTFGAAGTTNNFISLKTLIERLSYVRQILEQFWNTQLVAIQKSLGLRFPAKVEFDRITLSDDASEKRLLIELADRCLISDELLQHRFGNDPELERIRINRENRERKEERLVPKAGPYHNANLDGDLRKIALQSGVSTPSEVGLELEENKDGQKSALVMREQMMKSRVPPGGPAGKSGQGRPKNSGDKQKRKPKKFTPKLKAMLDVWVASAREYISAELNPGFLETFNKANFRQLTTEQANEVENIKFGVLCNLEPLCELNREVLSSALRTHSAVPGQIRQQLYNKFVETFGKSPTLAELRELQKSYYISNYIGEEQDG